MIFHVYSFVSAICPHIFCTCLAICPHIFVLRIFPIVCIFLQIALDWGLLAAVQTSLIWHFWESFSTLKLWKMQTNKHTNNNYDLCFWFGILAWDLDLGFWLGILHRYIKCFILMWFSCTWTFHGPIKSTVHSSNGIDWTSRFGKNPYLLPFNVFLWQKSQLKLSTIQLRSLW